MSAAPGHAQTETETVLLSNVGLPTVSFFDFSVNDWEAQGFRTGGHDVGYELTGVSITGRFPQNFADGVPLVLTLRADDDGSPADTALATFTPPNSWVSGANRFTLATSVQLDKDTLYWIHLESDERIFGNLIGSTAANSTSAAGWSFGRLCESESGEVPSCFSSIAYEMTLHGNANPVEKPAAIDDLSAAASVERVTLSWTVPGDGGSPITGFEYRQSTDGGTTWSPDWTPIADSGPDTDSYAVTGLARGTAYTFQVRAVNEQGDADASNNASGTTGTTSQTPAAITDLQALARNADVVLSWTVPDPRGSPITGFEYRTSADGGTTWASWTAVPDSGDGGANRAGYTVSGLTTGVEHTIVVRARNDVGVGGLSNEVSARPVGVPHAIDDLSAVAGNAEVTLSWTVPGNGGSRLLLFQYRQSTNGGTTWSAWTRIQPFDGAAEEHTVTGLANGTAYTFQVRARNVLGSGADSNSAGATPAAPPDAIDDLTASTDAIGEVDLAWTVPGDGHSAITGFEVRRKRGGDSYSSWTAIADSGPGTASHTVAGLEHGRTYTFQVRAVNGQGEAEASNEAAVRTLTDFGHLQAGQGSPTGLWSPDGSVLWVGNWSSRAIRVYDLSSGNVQPEQQWQLASGNDKPTGIWSDSTHVYVVQSGSRTVYRYLQSDKSRAGTNLSLDTDNSAPRGIWSDGTTAWVADSTDDKVYAYQLSDFTRDAGKDIELHPDNGEPRDLWSDGTWVWVVDNDEEVAYAYRLTDGKRHPGKDMVLDRAGANYVSIWSDGTSMLVLENASTDSARRPAIHTLALADAGWAAPPVDTRTVWVNTLGPTQRWTNSRSHIGNQFTTGRNPFGYYVAVIGSHPNHTRLGNGTNTDPAAVSVHTARPPNGNKLFDLTVDTTGTHRYHQTPASAGADAVLRPNTDYWVRFAAPSTSDRIGLYVRDPVNSPIAGSDGWSLNNEIYVHESSVTSFSTRIGTSAVNLVFGGHACIDEHCSNVLGDWPSAPQNMTLSRDGDTGIVVQWAPPLSAGNHPHYEIDGYLVEVSTDGGTTWTELEADLAPDTRSYSHDSTDPIADQRYRVVASNINGYTDDRYRSPGARLTSFSSLSLANDNPHGIWSPDGSVLWATQNGSTQIYAYDLADETADAGEAWTLHTDNNNPRHLWSNDSYIWVTEADSRTVYQYNEADRTFSTTRSLRSGNDDPNGIWSNGRQVWVADDVDDKLYAHRLSDFNSWSGLDMDLHADNDDPRGIWSDGATIWVLDEADERIYAYGFRSSNRGTRQPHFDILLDRAGVQYRGIWSDGTTMFVLESARAHATREPRIHRVPMPGDLLLSNAASSATATATDINQSDAVTQSFSTGDNYGGYLLNGISLVSSQAESGVPLTVTLRADDGGAPSSETLATFTNPGEWVAGANFLNLAPRVHLAPSATYWVHLEASGEVFVDRLGVLTADSGSAEGWSFTQSCTAADDCADEAFKMTLYGTAVPEHILVSNTEIDLDGAFNFSFSDVTSWAQPFITGSSSAGYDLTEVAVIGTAASAALPPTVTVTLRARDSVNTENADAEIPSNTPLATFANPESWVAGLNVFELDSPFTLDPDTKYFVHFVVSGGSLQTKYSSSLELDSFQPGWSIGDRRYQPLGGTAFNDSETGDGSIPIRIRGTVNPITVPRAIDDLSADKGDGSVTLTWTAPYHGGSPITKLQYRYKTDGSYQSWTDISDSGPATTTHTVTGLTNGATYTFQVRAVSDVGNADSSNEAAATPGFNPEAIDDLSAAAGDASVTLNWTLPGDGGSPITRFEHRHSTDGGTTWGSWTGFGRSGPTTVTGLVSGLVNGTEYTFQVRAVNAEGVGPDSNNATATPFGAPGAIDDLSAAAGDAKVELSWSAPDNGGAAITKFQYRQKEGSDDYGSWTDIDGSGAATESHTVTGLTNGTAYTFEVRAVNPGGDGAASNEATATPQGLPVVTIAAGADVTEGADAVFTLTRNDTTGALTVTVAVTETEDMVASSDEGSQTVDFTDGSDTATLTVPTVDDTVDEDDSKVTATIETGTDYAVGADGSATVTVSDDEVAAPGAPASLTAAAEGTEATLTWTAPSDDGGATVDMYRYRHKLATDTDFGDWTEVAATTLTATVTGLTGGSAYDFEVQARNSVGWGPSASASATAAAPVLASNDGQTPLDAGAPFQEYSWLGQQFTTGAHAGTSLKSVGLIGTQAQSLVPVTVTLRSDNGSNRPSTGANAVLATFASPSAWIAGENLFTLSSPYELERDTKYWVYIDVSATISNTDVADVAITFSGSLDERSKAGWSFGRACDNDTCSDNYRFQMVVRGTLGGPVVTIAAGSDVTEGADAEFTLTRGDTTGALAVTVEVSETGDMVDAGDEGSQTVDFADGTATATLSVSTVDDSADETNSHVTATIQSGAGYGVGTPSWDTVTVADNDFSVPGAPTSLTATAGNAQVSLSWSAPSSDGGAAVTMYRHRHKLSSAATWGSWTEVSATTLTATVTGLTNDSGYDFEVQASNSVGWGESASATATPKVPDPVLLSNTGQTSRVTGDNINRYDWSAQQFTTGSNTAGYTLSSIVLSGLLPEATVPMTVTLRADNGSGRPSSTDLATFANPPSWADGDNVFILSTPVELNANTGYWVYMVATAQIQMRLTGSTSADSGSLSGWSFGDVCDNSNCYTGDDYQVALRGTVKVTVTAPGAPTSLTATAGDAQVDLSWAAPSDDGGAAVDKYRHHHKLSSASAWGAWTEAAGTTATVTGLTNGSVYDFEVQAQNSVGWGESASASATPKAPDPVLVSNTGKASIAPDTLNLHSTGPNHGQQFTTGSDAAGYMLSSVSVKGGVVNDSVPMTVTLRADDSGAPSSTVLATFANPPSWALGDNVFTLSAPVELDADTTYWVYMVATAEIRVNFTSDTSVDSESLAGWSMGTRCSSAAGETCTAPSVDRRLQIALRGTVNLDSVLLKNTDQSSDGSSVVPSAADGFAGQQFTTGSNLGGYTLRSVTVPLGLSGTPTMTMSLRADDGSDMPASAVLATFAAPSPLVDGDNVFTLSTPYELEADTTYWLYMTATSGAESDFVNSVTADSDSQAGWSFGRSCDANGCYNNSAIHVVLRGTVRSVEAPGAPTSLTATAGNAQAELSWAAPSDDGGAAVDKYRHRHKLTSASTWGSWTEVSAATLSATVTGLTNDSAYDFEVQANNSAGWGASASASATPTATVVLVSNAGQGQDWHVDSISTKAQRFTTGSNSAGYTLTSVEIISEDTEGDDAAVSVCTVNASGHPTSDCTALTAPGSFAAGTLAFTAPANTKLDADTTYTVVISSPDYDSLDLDTTDSDGEDAGGATGWSIADAYESGVLGSYSTTPSGDSIRITVKGTPRIVPGAPTSLTATAGDAQVGLSWAAPSDDGGAAVTKYRHRHKLTSASDADWGTWIEVLTGTTATVTGLTNGSAYDFQVQANNSAGWGASASASATPRTVPGSPTSFSATAGDAQVSLSWSAPSNNGGAAVDMYRYRHKLGTETDFGDWTEVSAATLSATVTGLTNGSAYDFEVQAQNSVGWGASASASATPATAPGAPTSFTATAGDAQVSLSWSAPSSDGGAAVDMYRYRHKLGTETDFGDWTEVSAATLSATVTGLTNGGAYDFEVQAQNSVGWGASASASATPATVPGAPTSFAATAGDAQVGLSWAAPSSNGGAAVTKYRHRHKLSSGSTWGSWTEVTGTTATVTGLTNGSAYDFEAQAQNSVGWGASASASATPATVPGAPTSFAATAGDAQVSLSWAAPASDGGAAVTKYRHRHKLSSGSTWGSWTEVTGTTATVTGLTNGSAYDFEVQANNSVGWGASASASATPAATVVAPGAPASLTATAGDGQATLGWTAPSSDGGAAVTMYRHRHKLGTETAFGDWTEVSAATLSATVTGLTNGGAYDFEVQAQNSVGWGAAASASTTLTAPVVTIAAGSDVTEGADAEFTLTRDLTAGTLAVTVAVSETEDMVASSDEGSQTVDFTDGTATATLSVSTVDDSADESDSDVSAAIQTGTGYTVGSDSSATVTVADNDFSVPGAPTGLSASAGDGQVALSWTVPGDGGSAITKFQVRRKEGAGAFGSWSDISGSGAATASHTVTGLTNGTAYTFEVRAVNAVGEGAASNQASATPSATATAPGAPASLTATAGDGQATLGWTAPSSDGGAAVTMYRYRHKLGTETAFGDWTEVSATTLTATVTGLTNGSAYDFEVQAQNSVGWGAAASASTTLTAPVVTIAAGSDVTEGADAVFTLTRDLTSGTLAVTVAVSETEDMVTSGDEGSQTVDFTDGTATATLSVSTVDDSADESDSDVSAAIQTGTGYTVGSDSSATVTVSDDDFSVPGAPTSLSASAGDAQVALSWTVPGDGGSAITKFQVRRKEGAGAFGSWSDISGSGAATASHTVTGLTNGTAYTFEVRAVNAVGEGAASNQASATPSATATAPGAPASLTATAGDGQATLSWTAPSSDGGAAVTMYRHRHKLTSAATWGSWTEVSATTLTATVTGLTNGSAYDFEVQAQNSVGWGASASASATPATVPGAPTSFAATAGDTEVSLSWAAPSNDGGAAVSMYRYRHKLTSAATWGSWTEVSGTTAMVTGLTNGSAYDFEVEAENSVGWGASASASATPSAAATVPGAPASLTATAGVKQIALSWTAPASDGGAAITGYTLQVSDSDPSGTANWADVSPQPQGTATTYTHTGLGNGAQRWYQVSATNSVGAGAYSASATATTHSVPGAPASLTATAGDGKVDLIWTAPSSDGGASVSMYRHRHKLSSASAWGSWTEVSATTLTATVTGLTNGSAYDFEVQAQNSVGWGASASASATPSATATAPGAPASLTATAGVKQIALSWTAPASDGGAAITGYTLQVSDSDPSGTANWADVSPQPQGTATTYTHTGLGDGAQRWYRVSATNSVGAGAYSASATATTHNVPGAPASLTATAGDGKVDLSWTAPGSDGGAAVTMYRYRHKLNSATNWGSWTEVSATTLTATVTGLTNGGAYDFEVQAQNSVGWGAAASASTTLTAPVVTIAAGSDVTEGADAVFTLTRDLTSGALAVTVAVSETEDMVASSDEGSQTVDFTDGTATATLSVSTVDDSADESDSDVSAAIQTGTGYTVGSDSSATVTVSDDDFSVPGAPTSLSASAGDGQVSLSWAAPSSNGGAAVTKYRHRHKLSSASTWGSWTEVTGTSATVTGLTNGSGYDFEVQAQNSEGWGASASASATPTATVTLISNVGQGGDDSATSNLRYSQRFTTGSNAPGYTLTSVELVSEDAEGDDASVSVCTVDGSGLPTSTCTALTAPGSFAAGTLVFTAPSDTTLDASTTYTLLIRSPGRDPLTLDSTTSNGEDTGKAAGWSIANAYQIQDGGGNWLTTSSGESIRITVKGTVRPVVAPGAPTSLTATAGVKQIALSWTAPASDGGAAITGYTLQASDSDPSGTANWADVSPQPQGTATTYTHTGLGNGAERWYRVSATNSVGAGAYSASATATTHNVPARPASLTATAGDAQVALIWTAPSSDGGASVTKYRHRHKLSSASAWGSWTEVTGTTATVTGLTNGSAYDFEVEAENSAGWGASASASATPATVPGAPTSFAATAGDTEVSLSWSAPSSDGGAAVTKYRHRHKLGSANSWGSWTEVTGTTATVTGLTNGSAYDFEVQANNSAGWGASASASATPAEQEVLLSTTGSVGGLLGGEDLHEVQFEEGRYYRVQVTGWGSNPMWGEPRIAVLDSQYRELVNNRYNRGPTTHGPDWDYSGDGLGAKQKRFWYWLLPSSQRTPDTPDYWNPYYVDKSDGGTGLAGAWRVDMADLAECPEATMCTMERTPEHFTQDDISYLNPFTFKAPASGTYFVQLRSQYYNRNGYRLTVTRVDTSGDDEPVESAATAATAAADGSYHQFRLEFPFDRDWVKFANLTVGNSYEVRVKGSIVYGCYDCRTVAHLMSIRDADGAVVDSTGAYPSRQTFTATSTTHFVVAGSRGGERGMWTGRDTRWYVKVTDQSGAGGQSGAQPRSDGSDGGVSSKNAAPTSKSDAPTAPAPVVDDYGDTPDSAQPLADGEVLAGEIETSGDKDWFRAELTAGHRWRVRVIPADRDGEYEVNLYGVYDANGNLLVSWSADWFAVDLHPPADGVHYFAVGSDNPEAVGAYTIKLKDMGPSDRDPRPRPETGLPTISGTAQVGETLTVDTSGISDEDGLTNATFSYQWAADGEDIAGATGSTYTLVDADEGKAISVTVSFTDDAGNEESLTSAATAAVEARPNSPATGAPTTSGTAQVGETLTADASGIADEDGLTNAAFGYQWAADGADISGATDTTYTLVDADAGKAISVTVSFTDDAGNGESLTSAATAAVEAKPKQLPELPAGSTILWSADMTVVDYGAGAIGAGSADLFANQVSADNHEAQWLWSYTPDRQVDLSLLTAIMDTEDLVLHIGELELPFTDASGSFSNFTWYDVDVDWGDGQTLPVRIARVAQVSEPAENTPATGLPTISGTAQVGETLTADTSGISDEDGLDNVSYSYQWQAGGADIADATDATYTLADADAGKTVSVTVSFTDDVGNEESLTSAATAAVEAKPNSPATGAPTTSGTAQVGETLTADTSGIADEDGLDNVSFTYQWQADGADIAGATGSTYTLVDADAGKAIGVTVSFTDDAGNAESLTSAATEAVAPMPNSPATGTPTISGTAQVSETLTADTSGIADEDGLTNATFSYQWQTDGAEIAGATDSTYTLVDADEGKAVSVTVSFTDDAGNEESLTSAATAAVAGPPAEPLTASFSNGPSSHDGENFFTFELHFSEEFSVSYKRLRDQAFIASGGDVTRAKRLEGGSNIGWRIHVRPDGDGAVSIILPETTDCDDDGAICAGDGRMLSNRSELTVSGP